MRKWMYQAVTSTPGIEAYGDRVMTTGAGEGDEPGDSPTRPFIINRFGTKSSTQPQTRIKQQTVQVWIHWEPGTMLPIDEFAAALEKHIPALAPDRDDEGRVVMEAKWQDTSGDGYDDHYHTSTRYVTFLLTYNDLA